MAFGLVALWPYAKQVNQKVFCQSVSFQEEWTVSELNTGLNGTLLDCPG